jgi:thioredoxin reductase (NADPH)
MNTLFDVVIIGGGPAGLSAAITARARNKEVLVISNPAQENPLAASKLVDNYPGMPEATGLHILETMHAQAHRLGVRFLQSRAISIVPMQTAGNGNATHASLSVTTSSDFVEAHSVIIACGAASGGRPIKGEREYLGRGVSYCATCDGMLYRNSVVLVAGLSPEAVDEAGFLAEIGATVHYVAKEIPHSLDRRVFRHPGKLLAIEGDALGVTHAKITERFAGSSQDGKQQNDSKQDERQDETARNEKTQGQQGQEQRAVSLEVNGIFILRPGVAPTSLLASLETEDGYIKVDAAMRTNTPGVFAAGDCTGKPLQIAKAVGQGQIAVLSAVEYLGMR